MGTRSRIGILYGDGEKLKVKSIYCHWDGYPEYNGAMLMKYYNNYGRTEQLLELGDISVLKKKITPSTTHTFEEPEPDVTIAYSRDRGEEKRILEMDFEEFKDYVKDSDIEYVYLRYKDEWLYAELNYDYITYNSVLGAFRPLKYKIERLEKEGKLCI